MATVGFKGLTQVGIVDCKRRSRVLTTWIEILLKLLWGFLV